jgi:hypothetical protein
VADKKPSKKKLTDKQLQKLVDTAETALEELAKVKGKNRFDEKKAEMFALSSDGFVRTLGKYPDVYVGLTQVATDHTLNDDEVALVCETCGWAAPISEDDEEDVAPSEHSKKRRVRLTVLATRSKQMVSALVFQDDTDDTVYDYGTAKGTLADALSDTLVEMLTK